MHNARITACVVAAGLIVAACAQPGADGTETATSPTPVDIDVVALSNSPRTHSSSSNLNATNPTCSPTPVSLVLRSLPWSSTPPTRCILSMHAGR